MNKKISDLLDGYEDGGVELSGETPLSSARIKELTMKRITHEKADLRRAPFRLLAAAAAIAALTMTAFAAARMLGAGDLMAGLFEWWGGEPLNATQVETLNSMGHVFDGSEQFSVTSNGATMTPVAALADEDAYYLRLRVEAPEGVVLPDLDWDSQGHYVLYGGRGEESLRLGVAYSSWAERGEAYYGGAGTYFDQGIMTVRGGLVYGCETLPDADPTDNVKEIVLTIYSGAFQDIQYNDGREKQLILKGLWVERFDEAVDDWVWSEVFRGEFKLDIGGHFESRVAAIDCAGAEWTDPKTGEKNVLKSMKLSPLGLKFEFCSNVLENNGRVQPAFPGDTRIVMKNGTQLVREHGLDIFVTQEHKDASDPYFRVTSGILTPQPEWELGRYWEFGTPLDLSQVDYVQFGQDYIYPIRAD